MGLSQGKYEVIKEWQMIQEYEELSRNYPLNHSCNAL